ncbi:MAG: divergent polysaccharide deacetylase family protein [Proteobacteria bacterium]|nr:divergent polysaccharide deacetylase family protein [Pseudomonadota bacterium]
MAPGVTGRRRLPRFLRNGYARAYALILGVAIACAAMVHAGLPDAPAPAPVADNAPLPPPRPRATGSLKLPPASQLRVDFRKIPPADRADMSEVVDGQRLPKISASGWMPWIAYARRFDPAGPAARVGLLMINLGADEALTSRAIDELPGEISLAFLAGTPDLPHWLQRARDRGHECYLMLPVEDPSGPAERGIRPIEGNADPAENLQRLRTAMSRGAGYVGFVVPGPSVVSRSDLIARPLMKELADRGLALVEISPNGVSAMYHLTVELGMGYARSSTVLDYKLAGQGNVDSNLERLVDWVSERTNEKAARHDFGVLQPDNAAIDAIVAWRQRLAHQSAVSLVPIIGHFECREACMARLRRQPAQLKP